MLQPVSIGCSALGSGSSTCRLGGRTGCVPTQPSPRADWNILSYLSLLERCPPSSIESRSPLQARGLVFTSDWAVLPSSPPLPPHERAFEIRRGTVLGEWVSQEAAGLRESIRWGREIERRAGGLIGCAGQGSQLRMEPRSFAPINASLRCAPFRGLLARRLSALECHMWHDCVILARLG